MKLINLCDQASPHDALVFGGSFDYRTGERDRSTVSFDVLPTASESPFNVDRSQWSTLLSQQ